MKWHELAEDKKTKSDTNYHRAPDKEDWILGVIKEWSSG